MYRQVLSSLGEPPGVIAATRIKKKFKKRNLKIKDKEGGKEVSAPETRRRQRYRTVSMVVQNIFV